MGAEGHRADRNNSEIKRATLLILALTLLQVISGAWVTSVMGLENIYIFASLVHTMIIAGLFAVLCYLSIRVWQLQKKNDMPTITDRK